MNIQNPIDNWNSVGQHVADWLGVGTAQKQRQYEQYMSNTAFQRAIEDMKAAGLNPAMMYQSGGQGASTPSGPNTSIKSGVAMDLIGQTASMINSITNARRVDRMTKRNELKGSDATRLYRSALQLAKLMTRKV